MDIMLKIGILIICFASYVCTQNLVYPINPDAGLTETQLLAKYGYPTESHTVKTEDGYLLETFRIPYGRNTTAIRNRLPVLILPGLMASSACWLVMGTERGLGYFLADHGYDVWLGNYRGSTWSRKHEKFDPDRNQREFWNFSFQEMGYYDLPALIDYILRITKQDKLYYIGHSQGTTSFFVMASVKPEYNKKIKLMFGLSPVIYNENVRSVFIRLIARYTKHIQSIADTYKFYEILPHSGIVTALSDLFCNDGSPFQGLCTSVFYFIAGYSNHFNQSIVPLIGATMPAGASVKQLQHYGQLHIAKRFQHYDYGESENIIEYGQATPPLFNLTKITAPVALFYSNNDELNAVTDVERTASQLINVVKKKLISGFNHFDFHWASDVVPLVFNDVVDLMKQFE